MADFIDASGIIYVWTDYPPKKHPKLWAWIAQQVSSGQFQTAKAIDDEIYYWFPDLHAWLHTRGWKVISDSVANIAAEAEILAVRYEIRKGKRSRKGVDYNDLLLISTAKECGGRVVTNEAWQDAALDRKKKNSKIPLVCSESGVTWISFPALMKGAGVFPGGDV